MGILDLINAVEGIYLLYGYTIAFLASLIEISPMGWTIPGGTLLALGGFYAYSGKLSLLGILLFSWLGAWSTFILAYLLGNSTGYALVKKFRQEEKAKKAKLLLERHGATILTTSMMANFTRFWVAYIAGTEGYSFLRFLFYSAVASLAWSSLMVVVGYLAGSERARLQWVLAKLGILSWIIFAAVGIFLYLMARRDFKAVKQEK